MCLLQLQQLHHSYLNFYEEYCELSQRVIESHTKSIFISNLTFYSHLKKLKQILKMANNTGTSGKINLIRKQQVTKITI